MPVIRLRSLFLLPVLLGYGLLLPANAAAQPFTIDSPTTGSFFEGVTSVTVTGTMPDWMNIQTASINGIPVTIGANFSVAVPVDPLLVMNRITMDVTISPPGPFGSDWRESRMVVVGDGVTTGFVLDGAASPDGAILRIGDTGLAQIAPIVESLSSDALDVSELITGQNPIAQGTFGIIPYTANAVEVGFGGFGLAVDSVVGGMDTDIQIDDFFIEVDLELGFLGSCTLEVETTTANLTGSYDLQPLASDPSFVDVNLTTPVGVSLAGFTSQFVSGICNDPLIGDIVNLIIGQGDIQQLMQDGFEDNLSDPDGAGPLDSPLAAAIEQALAGISIAGPVGEALDGTFDSTITSVDEDDDGLSIIADAAIYATTPDPLAPDLPASYTVSEPVPTFGVLTPVQQLSYGMAFSISTSAMNQLLKTQIENGLLRQTVDEFLGFPLTVGVLQLFLPGLAGVGLPNNTPLEFDIAPRMAPLLTGAAGPGGELTEMKIGALGVVLNAAGFPLPLLVIEIDLDAGLDLNFTQQGLEFALNTAGAQIDVTVLFSLLAATDAEIVTTFEQLFPFFAADLENAIDAFPVPSLLGLELAPVEVSRLGGGYLGLFADLTLAPAPTIENVVFTDLSSGDFQQSGGCWLREWRHRVSGAQLGNVLTANARGMLGADAGCTTNDASSNATLHHRVNFDVVGNGQLWELYIDHDIMGAMDRISDGYNDGFGFQDGGGTATVGTVFGSWSIAGGASGTFDITPSATHISDGIGGGSNDEDVPFSGSNGITLQGGSTGASVELEFSVNLDAFSNSNIAFPTANGDEMAIRLGKNDTIDNNFTAGSYPGMGSRNIADDGHFTNVELVPLPEPGPLLSLAAGACVLQVLARRRRLRRER
jgi:hypothetical protein